MIIEKIIIKNFRNLKDTVVYPSDSLNIFLGDNAQGKTNFVESIFFCAYLKSFRTRYYKNLIQYSEKRSVINIIATLNNVKYKYDIKIENNKRTITINGKKPSLKQLYSIFNVIVYFPDELNLISTNPLYRRNLIDKSIFDIDYEYINIYKNYFRCLKQRNIFLKNKENTYDVWKDQLIFFASEIIKKRIKFINKINNYFKNNTLFLNELYEIRYSGNYDDLNNIEIKLNEEFEKKKYKEKEVLYTLVGPHREDVNFYQNGLPISDYCSQGQKKSLLISFKTAQIMDYLNVHGNTPILIIDDMSSGLDETRSNVFLNKLLEISGQTFITSNMFDINKNNCSIKKFFVKNGHISETIG